MNAVVVGGGLGGLAAAIRLAHVGRRVTLFERRAELGGKAGTNTLGPYRFDTGPSLLTMTHVFERLFSDVGRRLEDYVTFRPLETICNYFFDDGTRLFAYGDVERFAREIEEKTRDDAAAVKAFLERTREIHDTGAALFLERSLHEWSTYTRLDTLRSLLRFGRIDPFRSMDAAHRAHFSDPRTVQLFNRYATYNGSSPYRVPATLDIIPYVEYVLGAFAVVGGITAIPRALARLAREMGVTVVTGAEVTRIVVDRGRRVRGVAWRSADDKEADASRESEFTPAETVVCNVDVTLAYRDLLDDEVAPMARRYRRLEPSSSGLAFYWGISRSCPELDVNNVFFSPDYPAEFRALFDELCVPEDPTVYVNITSKVTPEDAPANGENWFVLVNAPRNEGQPWDEIVPRVRDRVLQRVSRVLDRDIAPYIAVEDVMTPADIEARTGSNKGSLYGISSNGRTAAFLRHPNRSRRYRGLYFCGGSAHPGGGMPLAVLSGTIAASLIERYER